MGGVDLGVIEYFQPAYLLQVLHDEYASESVVEGLFLEREGGTVGIEAVD